MRQKEQGGGKKKTKGGKKNKQEQPKKKKHRDPRWEFKKAKNDRKRKERNRQLKDDISFKPDFAAIDAAKADSDGPIHTRVAFESEQEGTLFSAVESLGKEIGKLKERKGWSELKDWAKENGMTSAEALTFIRLTASPSENVSKALGENISIFFGMNVNEMEGFVRQLENSAESRRKASGRSFGFGDTRGKEMLEERKSLINVAIDIHKLVGEAAEMQEKSITDVCADLGLDAGQIKSFGNLRENTSWGDAFPAFEKELSEGRISNVISKLTSLKETLQETINSKETIPKLAREIHEILELIGTFRDKKPRVVGKELYIKQNVVDAVVRAAVIGDADAFRLLQDRLPGKTLMEKNECLKNDHRTVMQNSTSSLDEIAVSELKKLVDGISALETITGDRINIYNLESILGTRWREGNAIDSLRFEDREEYEWTANQFGDNAIEKVKRIAELNEKLKTHTDKVKEALEIKKSLVSELDTLAQKLQDMLGRYTATTEMMEKLFEINMTDAELLSTLVEDLKYPEFAGSRPEGTAEMLMRGEKNEDKLETLKRMIDALDRFIGVHEDGAVTNIREGCLRELGYEPPERTDWVSRILSMFDSDRRNGVGGGPTSGI